MNKKIKVECLGRSASEVTQSIYQITANDRRIILDYGLYQCANIREAYNVNHTVIKEINPKKVDYILISHANIDHCGAIPVLYKRGCTAPVYVPKGNKELIRIMLYDSAKMMESDANKLRKDGVQAHALYDSADIEKCLFFVFERELHSEFSLCDDIMCEFTSAHHIVNSAQINLTFTGNGLVKRIRYTGDIGSPFIEKPYVEPFDYPQQCDLLIGECTYSGENRNHSVRDRVKDIDKIRTIISNVCVEKRGKVLFPVFALDRLQNILTVLYDIYHDEDFQIPIVVDMPLGEKICNIWQDIIPCDKEKWQAVMGWKAVRFTLDYMDSKEWQSGTAPCVVLASSGMCTNGRSVSWVKQLLPGENNHIVFCGYSATDTIAQKIKDGKSNRVIKVEDKLVQNKCGITVLNSFSSHACRSELMDLYTNCQYTKIVLVHSDFDSKCVFAEELKESLSKADKTSTVVIANTGMSLYV